MNLDGYFDEPKKLDRPRMLLTIGIPGSGKSYAIRRALEKGWVGISSDELRVNRLEQLAANG